jgi:hypothetical protein
MQRGRPLASEDTIPAPPEGFFPIPPPPKGFKPVVSTAEDVTRSAGAGLAGGTAGLVGGPGDVQEAIGKSGINEWLIKHTEGLGPAIAKKLGLPEDYFKSKKDYTLAKGDIGPIRLPTTEETKKATGLNVFDYEPQTTAGQYTKAGAEFVPGALTGGARTVPELAANVARFGVAPGVAQEFVGKQLEGTPFEKIGRIATAIGTSALTGKLISPNASKSPEASRAAYAGQVRRLDEEGIPVTAGERADLKGLRQAEDEANPQAYKDKLEAVTRAATRQVGNGRGGTYETPVMLREQGNNTLDNMLTETGQRFENLSRANTLHPDAAMGQGMVDLRNHYSAIPGAYTPAVENALNGAATHVSDLLRSNGAHPVTGLTHLTGEQYQRIRSNLRAAARSAENPQHAAAMNDFVNLLDDAMERSVARHNPLDAGAFPQARRDYKNALVVEDASKATNVAGAEGYITPAKLEAAAAKIYGRRAHERGHDPFDFAPAAKAVLKVEPNSGTAGRLAVHELADKFAGAIGAIAGSHVGSMINPGTEGSVQGLLYGREGLAPLVAPFARKGMEAALMSRPGQAVLGNQILARPGTVGALRQRIRNPVTGEWENTYSVPGLLTAIQAARQ